MKIWETDSYYADKPGTGQVPGRMVPDAGAIRKKAITTVEIFIEVLAFFSFVDFKGLR